MLHHHHHLHHPHGASCWSLPAVCVRVRALFLGHLGHNMKPALDAREARRRGKRNTRLLGRKTTKERCLGNRVFEPARRDVSAKRSRQTRRMGCRRGRAEPLVRCPPAIYENTLDIYGPYKFCRRLKSLKSLKSPPLRPQKDGRGGGGDASARFRGYFEALFTGWPSTRRRTTTIGVLSEN